MSVTHPCDWQCGHCSGTFNITVAFMADNSLNEYRRMHRSLYGPCNYKPVRDGLNDELRDQLIEARRTDDHPSRGLRREKRTVRDSP
jgi:hypothetical protein